MKNQSAVTSVLATCAISILGGTAFGYTGSEDWPNTEMVRGICYQPIPYNAVASGECWYESSDVSGSQFSALYGDGSGFGVSINGTARNDVQSMHDASFNVIRLYDWNGQFVDGDPCSWGSDNPGPPSGGDGHVHFLEYCADRGIKVIVPISNYALTTPIPEQGIYGGWVNDEWQDIVDGIIESCIDPTTGDLHRAVHSFSVGNETDIPESCNSGTTAGGEPNNYCMDRACQVANRLLTNPHVIAAGVKVTIPISNRRNGTSPNWDHSPFLLMEQMRDGTFGTDPHPVSNVVSPISNPITDYSRFYNSIQAFQQDNEYIVNIIEPYDSYFMGTLDEPKLIFTEWGFPVKRQGICDTYQGSPDRLPGNSGEQAEFLINALTDTWGYSATPEGADTLFRGICIFQWQDSRSAAALQQGCCNMTFGLHKWTNSTQGSATASCFNCGGTWWTDLLHYDIDTLLEIQYNGSDITGVIKGIWAPTLYGDMDGNGVLEKEDILLLINQMGYKQNDTDFDRDVDGGDLGQLLADWGFYGEGKP